MTRKFLDSNLKSSIESTVISGKCVSIMSGMCFINMFSRYAGSTANAALGLGSLKEQREHFGRVFMNKQPKKYSPEIQKRLKHGTDHESDAMATLVSKVLPVYRPKVIFKNTGCYLREHRWYTFLITSPDGEGWQDGEQILTFEFKCPFPKPFATPVFYKYLYITYHRYLANLIYHQEVQCLIVSFCVGVQNLLLLSWYKMMKHSGRKCMVNLLMFMDVTSQSFPKRNLKLQRQSTHSFLETNVQFLGEFPSVHGKECQHSSSQERPN